MGELKVEASAFRGVTAVLAEYLTAKAFAIAGSYAVWSGGGGGMHDTATHPEYTDVKKLTAMPKTEQQANPGYAWQLRRPRDGFFTTHDDHGRLRTHLALIRFDAEPDYEIREAPGGAVIEITFTSARISHVETEIVNEWMVGCTRAWAYLPEAGLDAYQCATIGPGGEIRWPV